VIPRHVRSLFWDIDSDRVDVKSFPDYTIARILEWGDEPAYAWLKVVFSEEQIKGVLLRERRLTRRSANFWALVYDLPREEVAALASP
jgi:Family of unknown function (DUF6922)